MTEYDIIVRMDQIIYIQREILDAIRETNQDQDEDEDEDNEELNRKEETPKVPLPPPRQRTVRFEEKK